MASTSINTFSLKPRQPRRHNSKTLDNPIYNSLKPSKSLLLTKKTLSLFSNSLKPVRLSLNCSELPILQNPSSNPSPMKKLSKFCTQKIVVFLLGSFIFMGSLNTRPVLALPSEETNYSEKLEEKRETRKGKKDEEGMYEELLKENPRNVEVLKLVLNEKMRKGKTSEALKYVDKLIKIQPDEVEWRLLQALCYQMMGDLGKAKRLFNNILAKKPLLLKALHGLAMVMVKKHENPAAVFEMLNKALEVARREKRVTEERNIRILIAQLHVVQGELEEGMKNFQILIDENPRDFRPYLCQGIIYGLLNKKKEAEEQFEIYRSLVPEEFPQRGFLDDVVLAAKKSSGQPFK